MSTEKSKRLRAIAARDRRQERHEKRERHRRLSPGHPVAALGEEQRVLAQPEARVEDRAAQPPGPLERDQGGLGFADVPGGDVEADLDALGHRLPLVERLEVDILEGEGRPACIVRHDRSPRSSG